MHKKQTNEEFMRKKTKNINKSMEKKTKKINSFMKKETERINKNLRWNGLPKSAKQKVRDRRKSKKEFKIQDRWR